MGTVTGRVTEAGNPLSGISVSLADSDALFPMGGPSSRTDDNGQFRMRNVEPGEYTLTVSPKGAPQPIERDVEVRARETTDEQVNLPTGVVAGRVTDAGSGRPIADVVVNVDPARAEGEKAPPRQRRGAIAMVMTASSGGDSGGVTTMKFGNEPDNVVTDSNGYYEVRYVSPGDYKVSISGSGIEKMEKEPVRVFEGQRSEGIDFKAMRGATLIVRPSTGSSDPIHFFQAKLTNQATGETDERMGAGNPSLRIDGLAAGSYLVEVTANEKSGELQVEIGSGEEKEVSIPIR
ncbi:MAG: carboxypeptidase-like regulatory domain-containing protein [Planctomycetota bacterium]